MLIPGVGAGYSSFELDNDVDNPALGGRNFPEVGPQNPLGFGWVLMLDDYMRPPVPVPDCEYNPLQPACNPEEWVFPWPVGPGVPLNYGGSSVGQRTPRAVTVAGLQLTAYDYTPIDGTDRLSFDWVDIGNVATPRIFIKRNYGITYEFEGYGSTQIDQMKWRMIRAYRGDWAAPDWERRYVYDSSAGHGGLIQIVDPRGVRTDLTWTQVTVGQGTQWRITQVSQQAPLGADPSWSGYSWSSMDVTLEYDQGYLVAVKHQPRTVRHDVTGKTGDGTLDPALSLEPIQRFAYDPASPLIQKPLTQVYEDLDGGSHQPDFSDCRLLVSYVYQDNQGSNLPWRVGQKNTGPDAAGVYALDTFAYDDVNKRCTWTDDNGVQRIYTHTNLGAVFNHNNTNYTVQHLPGNHAVTRYEVKDPNSPRGGYYQYASRVTTFDYVNCSCGAPSTIVYPNGLKYLWEFDSDKRGLPTKLTVTESGGANTRVWTWAYYDRSAHHKIRDQLQSSTDPTSYTIYHQYSVNNGVLQITDRVGGISGTVLGQSEYNDYGQPVWIERESFSVEGGGNSKGRVELEYGTNPTLSDFQLLKAAKRVHGSTSLTESFTYEGPGYLTSTTDAKGRTTLVQNNYMGWPTRLTLPTTKSGYVSGTGGMPTYSGQIDLEYDLRGQMSVMRQTASTKDGGTYSKGAVEIRRLYDGLGQLVAQKVDRADLGSSTQDWMVTTYTYDGGGRPLAVTDPTGKVTAYEIDGYNLPYRILEDVGAGAIRIRKFGFDVNGHLQEVVSSPIQGQPYSNQKLTFTLDGYGRRTQMTYPDGRLVEYVLDGASRVDMIKLHKVSEVARSSLTYDAITKRLTKVLDTIVATGKTRQKDYVYNGPLVSRVSDRDTGRSQSFFYDGFARTVRSVDNLLAAGSGNEVIREYDSDDTIKSVQEKVIKDLGQSTVTETFKKVYAYDDWSRLILIQDYGDMGQNPSAPLTETRIARDSLGNVVWTRGPKTGTSADDSQETDYTYDALGRVLQQLIHPRKGSTVNPISLLTSYSDGPSAGLSMTVTKRDGLGHTSQYDFDYGGRVVQRRLPGSGSGQKTWTYSYDVEDRLLQWVDGNGATVKLGYDSLGRLDKRYLGTMGAQALSALCTNETFAYDDLSRRNEAKTFQYVWPDSQGPSPSASLLVQAGWTLDALGRKTAESFGFGDDPQHQPLTTKTFNSSWGFASNKEDFGFRRGLTTPNGFSLTFTPDNIGRLSQASLSGNGLTNLGLAEYRFAGSRPVNRIHRLWSGSNRFETNYSYNAQRFLTQVETKYGTGTNDATVFTQTLVRDLVGKILEDQQVLADNSAGNRYSYDPFDRLQMAEIGVSNFGQNPTVAKTVQYALDDAQNRSSVTETIGQISSTKVYQVAVNSNQYDSVAYVPYTYDGNGNLISDGYYYYVYDYLDRLSEVYVITYQAGATSSTSSKTVVYTHAMQKKREGKPTKLSKAKANRLLATIRPRVRKELNRLLQARTSKTTSKDLKVSSAVNTSLNSTVNEPSLEFVAWYGYDSYNRRVSKVSLYESSWYGYDSWRLLEEYDGAWNPTVSYFDGIGIDEHLGMARKLGSTWAKYAFVQDQIGNVVRVVDETGATIARFEYDEYGFRTLVQGSPGFNIAYGFTGRYHDIETNLVYYRNRYYSPSDGRFVTLDSIGIWGDAANIGNGHALVGNRPLSSVDPLGLDTYLLYGWGATMPLGLANSAMHDLESMLENQYGQNPDRIHTKGWDEGQAVLDDIIGKHLVDPGNPVVLVGHSRGGTTVMWLLWQIELRNRKIREHNKRTACHPGKRQQEIRVSLSITLDQFWDYPFLLTPASYWNKWKTPGPHRDGSMNAVPGYPYRDDVSDVFPRHPERADIAPPSTKRHVDVGSDPQVNGFVPHDRLPGVAQDPSQTKVVSLTPQGQTHTTIDDWILGNSPEARLLRAGIANASGR